MLFNTQQTYGSVAKFLHWAIGFLILALLGVGFFMTGMDFSPAKLQVYGLHKSFGMLVLMLAAVRILWRAATITPDELESHKPWERKLAKSIHVLLYAGMFGMPLSGWAMSSAGDFPATFFGLFDFPDITGKDEALFRVLRQVHTFTALALMAGIALHMAGAMKHHFIDRDITLSRMTVRHFGFIRAGLLALGGGAMLAIPAVLYAQKFFAAATYAPVTESIAASQAEGLSVPQEAGLWEILPEVSSIKFTATQYGAPFEGRFERFDGTIVFDPDNLEASHAEIVIEIAGIKTGSDDRDAQALAPEWFDAAQFPQAIFKTTKFLKGESNFYEAHGELTIRGVSLPLVLPFTLDIAESESGARRAVMAAQTNLNRLAFGVGQGQWADPQSIGNNVGVEIHVEAVQ